MKILLVFMALARVSLHASVVTVDEGAESVMLPCQMTAPVPEDSLVEWSRSDPKMTVHVRRNNRDQPNDQNEVYRGRTTLHSDALKSGDLSLTLTAIRLVDGANYTCKASRTGTVLSQDEVLLHVNNPRVKSLTTQRDVFIVLFSLVLLAFIGCLAWIIITHKKSKDRSAANL